MTAISKLECQHKERIQSLEETKQEHMAGLRYMCPLKERHHSYGKGEDLAQSK